MANEVFKGLFGFSPEELTRQREAADTAMNYQAAQLDPFQQARFQGLQSYSSAARNLNTIGQKLFDIQDPQMRDATIIEQAFKSVDRPDSVEGIDSIIMQAKQAGASPQALERLMGVRNQVEMQQAKLATEQARATQLSTEKLPEKVQLLNFYNELPDTDPRKKMVEDMLIKDKAQSDPDLVRLQDARDKATPGSQRWKELDGFIKAKIAGESTRGKTDVKINMPGTQDAIDVPKFMNSLANTVQPYTQSIDSADRGLEAMKEVIERGNPIAYNAAVKSLVATLEKGNLSDKDIQAAGYDPSLVGRVGDWLSILGSGVPTKKTQQDVIRTLKVIKKVAATKQGEVINQQAQQLRAANFTEDQIRTLLGQYKTYKPRGAKPISEMSIEELRQEALK